MNGEILRIFKLKVKNSLQILLLLLFFLSTDSFALDEPKMIESGWTDSLMFTGDQILSLREAINFYRENFLKSNIGNEERNIEENPLLNEVNEEEVSPSFFMNSIIYESPRQWIIWLNDIKFTSKVSIQMKDIEELTPIEVKAVYVKFSMIVKDIDKLSPSWNNKLKVKSKGFFESDDQNISYYRDEDKIVFKLSPNQTFVLYNMQIEEGKKSSIPINPVINNNELNKKQDKEKINNSNNSHITNEELNKKQEPVNATE